MTNKCLDSTQSNSSVGSVADLRTGGHWFDPRLAQYSFQGLMIVIAIGFIPLSPLSVVSTMVMWESSQWLGKKYCAEYWLKELQESMARYTGRLDITERLLKNGVKHHIINQSIDSTQMHNQQRSIKMNWVRLSIMEIFFFTAYVGVLAFDLLLGTDSE